MIWEFHMKMIYTRLTVATLLLAATYAPSHGEDAVAPPPSVPPAESAPNSQTDMPSSGAPRASPVPRPSIVRKIADTTPAQPTDAVRPYRRHADRRYQRYAYWEPFPLYLPHLYHQRVSWSRIRWFGF
jgi:hypothetical protein